MKSTPSHIKRTMLIAAGILIVISTITFAQETVKFAEKGVTELGGNISLQSSSEDINGTTRNASTVFSVSPYIGYFVGNGFELGLNPFGFSTSTASGSSVTQIMVLAAPSFNFKTEGNAYLFIEALIGYTTQWDRTTHGGACWGGRGGLKVAVTGKGLLNIALQGVQISDTPNGVGDSSELNQFSISAGFSVWL